MDQIINNDYIRKFPVLNDPQIFNSQPIMSL